MKDTFRSFGKDLQALMLDGEDAVEILVPDRLTCLMLLNYGNHNGRTYLTLTDTLLRLCHLDLLDRSDIYRLGSMHPDDKPTVTTTYFECQWDDTGFIAKPVYFSYDADAVYKEITTPDGMRNAPLMREVALETVQNFSRFRDMGFMGPNAVKVPRLDIALDNVRVRVEVAVDRQISLEMLEVYRKNYEEEMAFLEECERKNLIAANS